MKPAIILPLFLRLSFAAEKYDSHITDASQLHASYDYVIAGGGTSGLVVANRLTENVNGKAGTALVLDVDAPWLTLSAIASHRSRHRSW